jgi:hypothetical protein
MPATASSVASSANEPAGRRRFAAERHGHCANCQLRCQLRPARTKLSGTGRRGFHFRDCFDASSDRSRLRRADAAYVVWRKGKSVLLGAVKPKEMSTALIKIAKEILAAVDILLAACKSDRC